MIVVDTSVIVAYMNGRDDHHGAVAAWLTDVDDELCTTPLILAEVDHLVATRGGAVAAAALRNDLSSGAYLVEWWNGAVAATVNVAARYADAGLGLADASLVALAERHATVQIATLDERHFRSVRPLAAGEAFRLMPADAAADPT